jgi:hypothetical protein
LYSRKSTTTSSSDYKPASYTDLLLFKRGRLADRNLRATDFLEPFYMLKYISILIPGLYYMISFGYGTVLFAATGSSLFAKFYHFNVAQTGLLLSIPLLIGCLIGEFNAGWVTDYMVYRYAKKNDGVRKPEARLDAIWLALLLPIGVIIDGVCLTHYQTVGWIGAAFGMGIACLGLQVATTVVYAYCTDVSHPTPSPLILSPRKRERLLTRLCSVINHKAQKSQQCLIHSAPSSLRSSLSTRESQPTPSP